MEIQSFSHPVDHIVAGVHGDRFPPPFQMHFHQIWRHSGDMVRMRISEGYIVDRIAADSQVLESAAGRHSAIHQETVFLSQSGQMGEALRFRRHKA
jgi:hypothetical protein